MPKTNRPTVQVSIFCSRCQTVQIIWRLDGRLRDKNHIKHAFCHICGRRTAHFPVNDE